MDISERTSLPSCNAQWMFPYRLHFREIIEESMREQGFAVIYNRDGSTPDLKSLKHIKMEDFIKDSSALFYIALENGDSEEVSVMVHTNEVAPPGLPAIYLNEIRLSTQIPESRYQDFIEFLARNFEPVPPDEDEPFGMERYEAEACLYSEEMRTIDKGKPFEFFYNIPSTSSPIDIIVLAKEGVDYRSGLKKKSTLDI
ncbi:MAG: hypothetical protein EA409_09310 [Saprospirales bacterium]|nr:MAG: hypothetical protein EA409_09310 [Saprospirales bacterium]